MAEVTFRDAISEETDTFEMYPTYTIEDVIEGPLRNFPSRLKQYDYECLLKGRSLNEKWTTRRLRLKDGDRIDVAPGSKFRLPVEQAAEIMKSSRRPLLFIGNGVSQSPGDEEDSISTKQIHYGFLDHLASADPRAFDEKRRQIRRLMDAVERRRGPEDMLSFMQLFGGVSELRESFVAFVIQLCCLAKPNLAHRALLELLFVLKPERPQLKVFTTNYDNLLEKTYREYGHLPFAPQYSAPRQKPKPGTIPVIPIHGSVRISRCPGCGTVLETQAAALGIRLCVYCGSEVPQVVLPTAEGEADKQAMSYLEEMARQADVLLFAGYGFKDPHIVERLERSTQPSANIIQIARGGAPEELKKMSKSVATIPMDVADGLLYLTRLIDPEAISTLRAVRERSRHWTLEEFNLIRGILPKRKTGASLRRKS